MDHEKVKHRMASIGSVKSPTRRRRLAWACGALLLATRPAWGADADYGPREQHGKRLFLYCAACHTLAEGAPDKTGPNLHGVVGARAGTRGDFAYSAALKDSGIVWNDETLNAWLMRPSALVQGAKMAFAGLPNDQDRLDVIAYLKVATR